MCPHCQHFQCHGCRPLFIDEERALECCKCPRTSPTLEWARQLYFLHSEGTETFFGKKIAGHA